MDTKIIFYVIALIALPYILTISALVKEIILWEPSLTKKASLILLVLLIPFAGAIYSYKYLHLAWFDKPSGESSGGFQNVVSGAMLEINAVFNPEHKHVIEVRQKESIELSENGQLYDNKYPRLNSVDSSENSKPE